MSQADSRISNSHRCSTRATRTQRRRATSRGEDQRISTTDYHLGQVAVAEADGEKQMGYDMTRARNWRDLRPVSAVADAAVKRACQGFGWKQAESAKVRCLFDPDMATSLLGTWLALLDGRAVYKGQSRFADAIDTKIAAEAFHLEDNPLIPKAVGSRPCDGEGVQSAPLTPVENGVLKHFFCDSYAARRLGRSVTGHSSGSSNCRLRPGDYSPEALLKELGTGFFVTGLQGHGFNTASGEWSRGASGFWVENGEITNPVQNVTLATNLAECYERLLAVGNDPLEESSTSSPSVLIDGIQLGGS
jgi:PmbA protein